MMSRKSSDRGGESVNGEFKDFVQESKAGMLTKDKWLWAKMYYSKKKETP